MNLATSLAQTMEVLAQGENVAMSTRWAGFLGVAENGPEYFIALATMYRRFGDVRDQIANCNIGQRSKNVSDGAVAALAEYANPSIVAQRTVHQLASQMDKIDLLHMAGEALPQEAAPELPASVEDLCNELENIRSDARTADIHPDLRRLIEDSLNALLMVVRCFDAFGPDGTARVYGSVLAELTREYAHVSPQAAPQSKPLLKRLIQFTNRVVKVVILAGGFIHGVDQIVTDTPHIIAQIEGSAAETPQPSESHPEADLDITELDEPLPDEAR